MIEGTVTATDGTEVHITVNNPALYSLVSYEDSTVTDAVGTIHSIDDMHHYFKLVANKDHWKRPVDAEVDYDDLYPVCAAIEFFTGSTPEFTELPGERFRVRAAGYFEAIGA